MYSLLQFPLLLEAEDGYGQLWANLTSGACAETVKQQDAQSINCLAHNKNLTFEVVNELTEAGIMI
ncbi:hypothetical protein SCA6_019386 [Theobroma cacao]